MAKANDKSPHQIGLSHGIAKRREIRRGSPGYRRSETAKAETFIQEAKETVDAVEIAPPVTDHFGNEMAPAVTHTPDPDAPKSTRKPRGPKTYTFTADQLREARVGRSWADVAKMLDLPNPGAARKAWLDLTGEPHTSAPELVGKRARRGSSSSARLAAPKWGDLTDRQEIVDRLMGSTITVKASAYGDTGATETLHVGKVKKYDDTDPSRPAVVFVEGVFRKDQKTGQDVLDMKVSTGATRTVFIDRIIEVR